MRLITIITLILLAICYAHIRSFADETKSASDLEITAAVGMGEHLARPTGSTFDPELTNEYFGVDLSAAFVSKYIWRGYDVFDDHAAFQPSVSLNLFQTGLSVGVWGSFALSSGYEDLDELDYILAWGKTFFDNERYSLDFSTNYIYYDFPNTSSELADYEEVGIGFALPNLLPLSSSYLIPSYYVCYDWPAHSGGPQEGWFHIFSVSYDVHIPAFIPSQDEQDLSLTADVTYNDGAFDADSDFSHATVSLATTFEWKGFTLTPSLQHQWSFEDTVNRENEFWAGVSLGYNFRFNGE